jgi:hypothetical protein
MLQEKTKIYEVYRDAEEISLEEINWQSENTGNPVLKARVSVDGRLIKNVTFKRDIASRAYAIPPATEGSRASGITILFGGMVQEILDNFADYLLPTMKPLGLNPLTGEKILDPHDRTNVREIENTKLKINGHQFVWQKIE